MDLNLMSHTNRTGGAPTGGLRMHPTKRFFSPA